MAKDSFNNTEEKKFCNTDEDKNRLKEIIESHVFFDIDKNEEPARWKTERHNLFYLVCGYHLLTNYPAVESVDIAFGH